MFFCFVIAVSPVFFDKQPLQLAGVRPSGQDSAFRQTLVAELASTAETWSIGCDIKGGFTLLLISFYSFIIYLFVCYHYSYYSFIYLSIYLFIYLFVYLFTITITIVIIICFFCSCYGKGYGCICCRGCRLEETKAIPCFSQG